MSSVHEGVKTDLDTYVRRAISPLNRVYLLNVDETEKKRRSLNGAYIGLSGLPKRFQAIDPFAYM